MITYHLFLFLALLIPLTACETNPIQLHRPACRDLRSKIIFNAATSETRRAEIDRAQEPLQQHTYELNNCDEH